MKKTFKSMIMTAVLATSMLFTSAYSAFAATNTYKINNVSVSYTSSSVKTNCWEYANQIYNKIWGYRFSNNRNTDDNMIKNITGRSALTLNETNLKKYVSVAAIGSVLRTTNDACLFANSDNVGHSQIIVKKDANGFTVFESNIGPKNGKYSREKYYTWKDYITTWAKDNNHKYIKYIKWSGAPKFSNPPQNAWTFADGIYTLTPKCATSKRLDISGGCKTDKTNVQIYRANNTASQKFKFTTLANGYYKITAMVSGKVLDVSGGCKTPGTNVWQYTSNGTSAQQWMLQDAGNGYFYIIPRLDTNLALDVCGAGNADGTNVCVYTKNYSGAQCWKLTNA